MAVVQTKSLLSFLITSLVHLTRMGSLVGFLDNSKSLLGSSGNRKAHGCQSPAPALSQVNRHLLENPARCQLQMAPMTPVDTINLSATNGSNDPI